MIQMDTPTVEEEVIGTTYHSKKVITFAIDNDRKEIDVTIRYDEAFGEDGEEVGSKLISIEVGVDFTWSIGQEHDRDLAISAAATKEVGKMFEDCDYTQTAQDAIAEKIIEKIDDELCEIG